MRCRTRTVTPAMVLPQWLEKLRSGALGLALASRAQQRYPLPGEGGFEVFAVVVLIADEDLPGPAGGQRRVVLQDAQQYLPLIGLGAGQCEPDGQPAQGGDQVQPQAPDIPGMGGAVPVLGP